MLSPIDTCFSFYGRTSLECLDKIRQLKKAIEYLYAVGSHGIAIGEWDLVNGEEGNGWLEVGNRSILRSFKTINHNDSLRKKDHILYSGYKSIPMR